ncbi:uncharacterized protein LOC127246148 isoform X1 [Andrographis paniculata]|uniref:uncharacterized protein LOC127246148 isoform X1 n=1 Tax=Andrographis paniculata TaxID=175694 RepID=UPI0021E85E7B|nr:uncharacterized protein LOC127246148 isoform X1 [Andrographis paniculata]XP_051123349.1 uncharacterized protein LOC127246148 isoform X1 [Andrographis paniculata]XP_051123350.1 uncharacterized protein LOC127246148 isoform X1 [Andrographis paniculata]
MAHQISHRRILAAPQPQETAMDPTPKRHPKPSPSTTTAAAAKHHLTHPLPDPTTATTPPSTIQTISHRFSKLCTHHKLLPNSLKPHSQPKNLILDSSCSTLTKSSSQKERITTLHPTLAKTKNDNNNIVKKPSSKKFLKKPSFEESDVKKSSQLLSRSMDSEGAVVKKKGFEEGPEMRTGRISLSLSSSIPPAVNGGRRRSFCNSQVELNDFLSCSGVKVVAVDMPPFMQIHAVDCARKAHDSLEKFTSKTLAFTLKKEFDGVYGPAWHCIVGTSFGSFVTHSVGGFIYFSMDHKLYILLFKTTVQRAE